MAERQRPVLRDGVCSSHPTRSTETVIPQADDADCSKVRQPPGKETHVRRSVARTAPATPNKVANIINHIALILDGSSSMAGVAAKLIEVADAQIRHLAQRSREMNQETRISVWVFSYSNRIECLVWDMDVLRMPSIEKLYWVNGQTAIIDATLEAINDLAETPEKHGDHSFLLYVMTDGAENDSRNAPQVLQRRIEGLPNHWTLAAMVPNAMAKHEAKRFGFPPGNVEVWDASSNAGVEEAGRRMTTATDNYMNDRASGVRSTRSLFSTDATAVNAQTIVQAGLMPLAKDSYILVPVVKQAGETGTTVRIDEFTRSCGLTYQPGRGFYQLMKREEIQASKDIVVVDKKTHKVYSGKDARQLVGLPDMNVRVTPDPNSGYDIFVQSSSLNRNLIVGTRYLYLIK